MQVQSASASFESYNVWLSLLTCGTELVKYIKSEKILFRVSWVSSGDLYEALRQMRRIKRATKATRFYDEVRVIL